MKPALRVIAVLGPTGSGKSHLAIRLAQRLDGEILSVDSMQVYRGMDIGTAKTPETERRVPHHLIDLVDSSAEYSVAEFQETGRRVLAELAARSRTAIIAGGSGLHFRALVDPLSFPGGDAEERRRLEDLDLPDLQRELLDADPEAVSHVDMANPRRLVRALEILAVTGATPSQRMATPEAQAIRDYVPVVSFVGLGLDPGERLERRVTARFDAMLQAGLLEEVADLAPRLGRTARQAVGYKELLPVVAGSSSIAEARPVAIQATLALAKRQRTFFRRDPRIRWLAWQDDAEALVGSALDALQEAGLCVS